MKYSTFVVFLLGAALSARAQMAPATTQSAAAANNAHISLTLPEATDAIDNGPNATTGTESFSLKLKGNEASRHFKVKIANPSNASVDILGVQTSPGFYVTKVPKSIDANSSTPISILYLDEPGTIDSQNFIKVLTSAGIQTILINRTRDVVVQFDQTSLTWDQGTTPSPKTVNITVTGTDSVPIGAQAFGAGNTATVTANGAGKWLVTITPGSTKFAGTFPVQVIFSPALPGLASTIFCDINTTN